MEYMTLDGSALRVSRLCMGGCPMGGYGWGEVDDCELVHTVQEALDSGVNFFDTADTYGLGKSEELLGTALQGRRQEAVIATKFGVRVENGRTFYDNSPKWIERAVEKSLKRLKTDYIDLYQIHYRDGKTPMDEVVGVLERLKEKGYIRYLGLSNIYKEDLEEIQPYKGRFVSFQDEFSLACRRHEKSIFFLMEEMNMTPLTWGSLGQGVLSGKYNEKSVFEKNDRRSSEVYVNFHGKKLKDNLEIVKVLKAISGETGREVPAVAIRFILDYLRNSVVLVGIKRPRQLRSNMQAFGWNMEPLQMNRLLEISR